MSSWGLRGGGGLEVLETFFTVSPFRRLQVFALSLLPTRPTVAMILSNSGIPHHNTGGFVSHRKFLADIEYGEALDTLVKACSDMLLISPDGERIFLGKRKVQPQPDWWFGGGRMFPGETPKESCTRLLNRELGL